MSFRIDQIESVSYSLDCREGHMKKNSLWVCFHRGQKNIDFCEIDYQCVWRFQHRRTISYRIWGTHSIRDFNHLRVQLIRFQGTIEISQSDFGNVEN